MLATRGVLELSNATLELTPTAKIVLGLTAAVAAGMARKGASYLRRDVWPNSARLAAWVEALRTALTGAVVAYGATALLSRAFRWGAIEGYSWFASERARDLDWAGHDVLLAGISLTWGAAVLMGQFAARPARRGPRLDPALAAAATLISVGAFAWAWTSAEPPDVAVARLDGSTSPPRANRQAQAPAPSSDAPATESPAQRAAPPPSPAGEVPPRAAASGPDAGAPLAQSPAVIDLDAPLDAAPE
jgi:hypothetical protein